MHMLHFQLRFGDDPIRQTPTIRPQDFYYNGPRCVIKPQELVVCVPCAAPDHRHIEANRATCELSTFQGWKKPELNMSVAAWVFDNQSDKLFILDCGETLFKFLNVGVQHKASFTRCRICPEAFFGFDKSWDENDEEEDMDWDDDVDSGIDGDFNLNHVYIAYENIDNAIQI